MKYIKEITISLSVAVLTFLGLNFVSAQETASIEKDFLDSGLGFIGVQSNYHDYMNAYYNDKFSRLNQILEDSDMIEDQRLIPPANLNFENYSELCGEENLSSLCVSLGAMDIFLEYNDVLSEVANQVPISGLDTDEISLYYSLEEFANRNREIKNEIERVEEILELTNSAYNEYMLSYPMHKKYEEIIDNLNNYKTALKYLRRQIAVFPYKFIDATTVYCK